MVLQTQQLSDYNKGGKQAGWASRAGMEHVYAVQVYSNISCEANSWTCCLQQGSVLFQYWDK